MNERIKQIVDAVNIPHQVGDNCYTVSTQELEEFAKLIVAECIEVFGKDLPKIDDKNFNILDLTNRICNVAEHFEIKD